MKKQPSESIIKLHNDLIKTSKEDIYRDNPSKEILDKRKSKKKRREKQLENLELKYNFDDKENIKEKKTRNTFNSVNDKYINQFTYLKQLKNNLTKEFKNHSISFNNYRLQYIYHTIETEKMNAADMYSMMKALQTELKNEYERKCSSKKERCKQEFEKRGGMKKYNQLKNYLTDIGVNVHEIN